MRRQFLRSLLVVVALTAAACGGSTGSDRSDSSADTAAPAVESTTAPPSTAAPPSPASSEPMTAEPVTSVAATAEPAPTTRPAPTTPATVEELTAALAADHGGAAWYASFVDARLVTVLGAPVLVVHLAGDEMTLDQTARQAAIDEMCLALDDYDSPLTINVGTVDDTGRYATRCGGGVGVLRLAELVTLPPAPTTPAELQGWLATVFGPGGLVPLGAEERWYGSITGFGTADYGAGPELQLTTTLGAADGLELGALQSAVELSGTPMVAGWSITSSTDCYMVSSAGSPCAQGPGWCGGYFYPAPG